VVEPSKAEVLGEGSICGVDERFHPDPAARSRVRTELGVPGDAVVFLFLGRLSRDKGVIDLARAFAALAKSRPSAHLVVAGPDEEGLSASI